MKKYAIWSLFIFSVLWTGCVPDAEEVLEKNGIEMNGANEVPSNNATAVGSIDAKYNKATNVLTYSISWSGLSGNHKGISLYNGSTTTNGNVVKVVQSTGSPTNSLTETWTVPENLRSTVESGGIYVNILSDQYPSGEIRGQISF